MHLVDYGSVSYLGHTKTRLLDGGFKAWLAADGPVSKEAVKPPEVSPFPI